MTRSRGILLLLLLLFLRSLAVLIICSCFNRRLQKGNFMFKTNKWNLNASMIPKVSKQEFFPLMGYNGTGVKLGTDALGLIKSGCEVLAWR